MFCVSLVIYSMLKLMGLSWSRTSQSTASNQPHQHHLEALHSNAWVPSQDLVNPKPWGRGSPAICALTSSGQIWGQQRQSEAHILPTACFVDKVLLEHRHNHLCVEWL